MANTPPTAPTWAFPLNGATKLPPGLNYLQWYIATDSDGDEIRYDLYFGTTSDPPLLASNLYNGWMRNNGSLEFVTLLGNTMEYINSEALVTAETTYYWKVVAKDGNGGETSSAVFTFSTARENSLPSKPVSLYPTDGATDVLKDVTLSWQASTDPDGDPVTYNVYVGRVPNNLQPVATSLTVTEFDLNSLEDQGYYYWRVAAVDGYNGYLSSSDIHSFQVENYVPDQPVPGNLLAPSDGKTNTTFRVTFSWEEATDKDNDPLTYDLYVGQDPNPQHLIASGLTTNTYQHTLAAYGRHYWKVVVKDGTGFMESYPVFSFTTWGNRPDFSIETVYVEGGTFIMGSDLEPDEKPPHEVRLDDFLIAKYEVVNQHYVAFLNSIVENTSLVNSLRAHRRLSFLYKNVTFNGRHLCQVFDATRTDRSIGYEVPFDSPIIWNGTSFELDPFFENHPVKFMTYDGAAWFARWLGNNYRLPTEAEWEYAAMGGNRSEGYLYSGSNDLNQVAAHNLGVPFDDPLNPRYTSPVGQYKPNELGIYDMTGNVNEICKDFYSPTFYGTSPSHNPLNTTPFGGRGRVARGGSHTGPIRVKRRGNLAVLQYINDAGIRLAQTVITERPGLSGAVIDKDGNPLESVRLSGFSENVQSDANGRFNTREASGWSGIITPVLEGYTFTPESIDVTNLTSSVADLNFTATFSGNYLIKGTIKDESGTPMQQVTLTGLPQTVSTDALGEYEAEVPAQWSGTIRPTLADYTFSPESRSYDNLNSLQEDQHFTGIYAGNYLISGTVSNANSEPIAGVLLDGFPGEILTNNSGYYEAEVPAGWSGTVIPFKEGFTFVPEQKTFAGVKENIDGQDFQRAVISGLHDEERNFVKIYPNPTRGGAIIQLEERLNDPATLEITTLQGGLIKAYQLDQTTLQVYWNGNNERGVPADAGVYLCRIVTSKGIISTLKIVVIK